MAGRAAGYEDLLVWQRGISLTKRIYRLTASFPAEERFGLISQMRRAACSIPSNLAEGQARHTTKEFIRFVSNAEGSLAELSTQLHIAAELEFCDASAISEVRSDLAELRRMLNALRRKLGSKGS